MISLLLLVVAAFTPTSSSTVLPAQVGLRARCFIDGNCWCVSSSSSYGYCMLSEFQCVAYGPSDARCDSVSGGVDASRAIAAPLVIAPLVPLDFSYLANPLLCSQTGLCWCYSATFGRGYCVPNEALCRSSASTVVDITCVESFSNDDAVRRDRDLGLPNDALAPTPVPLPCGPGLCLCRFSWNNGVSQQPAQCYYPFFCAMLPNHSCV